MVTVGVCFGRFNPPHKGHKEVWKTAAKCDAYYVGTNASTRGPKDPLPFDIKLKAMAALYPDVVEHIIPSRNIFSLVVKIYEEFGEHIELKICTDEEWIINSLNRYNGVCSSHGFFKFDIITQEKTPRLSAASTLREAVKKGDKELFSDAAGISADTEIQINNRVFKFFDIVGEFIE